MFNDLAFKDVFGPKYARNSVTLNSSYWEKVKTTYYVLFGEVTPGSARLGNTLFDKKYKDGLLDVIPLFYVDYLVASLRDFTSWLSKKIFKFSSVLGIFTFLPLLAISLATSAVSLVLRAALSVVSFAITLAVAVTILPVMQVITGNIWKSMMRAASKFIFAGNLNESDVHEALKENEIQTNRRAVRFGSTTIVLTATGKDATVKDLNDEVTIADVKALANDKAKAVSNLVALDYDGIATAMDLAERPRDVFGSSRFDRF